MLVLRVAPTAVTVAGIALACVAAMLLSLNRSPRSSPHEIRAGPGGRGTRPGAAVGIYSVCSAHPSVLEAALQLAARTAKRRVIEATSNQVNQDGGYTGMRPAGFPRPRVWPRQLASACRAAARALGGDHLGPNAWQRLEAAAALTKAGVMVAEYVTPVFARSIWTAPCAAPTIRAPRAMS